MGVVVCRRIGSPLGAATGEVGGVPSIPILSEVSGLMFDVVRYYLNLLAVKTGKGQGLVEYALIIVLISVVSILILGTLGSSVSSVFSRANAALVAP